MQLIHLTVDGSPEVVSTITVTERQWAQWCDEAERAGLTPADYLRRRMTRNFADFEALRARVGDDAFYRWLRSQVHQRTR